MTPRTLDWLIRLHGPALAAWPERERRDALALLRRSAQARSTLAAALADDAVTVEDDDAAALARMREGLDEAIAARMMPARFASGARWGALAACAMLGIWLGAGQASADQQGHADRDLLQAIASLSPASGLGALQP
ncbi:MAG: hypothetical protein JO157_15695 [Acetobacteraceae bacterium]|nr:hypothetical protein [Acetobacteraceae bacterium]